MGLGLLTVAAGLLAACATSSQVLTGTARAPLSPAQVTVYTSAPASYEEIAQFSASRNSVTSGGGERAIATMIAQMRAQAALLGANGLLLEDFADAHSTSVGADVGSDSYTHNASISIGLGASVGIAKKTAKAKAVFVPPAN